jgi:hypothetical protein
VRDTSSAAACFCLAYTIEATCNTLQTGISYDCAVIPLEHGEHTTLNEVTFSRIFCSSTNGGIIGAIVPHCGHHWSKPDVCNEVQRDIATFNGEFHLYLLQLIKWALIRGTMGGGRKREEQQTILNKGTLSWSSCNSTSRS